MDGIDRGKVRLALRRADDETRFYLLHEALALLSDTQLETLVARYFNVERLRSEADAREPALLAEVQAFDQASRRGEYYESFQVNYKNSEHKSSGTLGWIVECQRLLELCATGRYEDSELCEALDTLFRLLSYIDEEPDGVIFFADEGGSWQVGVDWKRIFPVWFSALSSSADADTYAAKVIATIDEFARADRKKYLDHAKRVATPEQGRVLESRL